MVNRVYAVPVSSIHPNPDQPRRIFEKDELLALSASIAENGLLQPISLMREENGSYRIIAGERRFLACKMLGMEEIPAIVCSVGQGDAAVKLGNDGTVNLTGQVLINGVPLEDLLDQGGDA